MQYDTTGARRTGSVPSSSHGFSHAGRCVLFAVQAVAAATSQRVVAAGERGNMAVTSDGEVWSSEAARVAQAVRALAFHNSTSGWIMGENSFAAVTHKSGASWSRLAHPVDRALPRLPPSRN